MHTSLGAVALALAGTLSLGAVAGFHSEVPAGLRLANAAGTASADARAWPGDPAQGPVGLGRGPGVLGGVETDTDGDGVVDTLDNCPLKSNPGQEDSESATRSIILRPSGGANDGTDEGSANAGKDTWWYGYDGTVYGDSEALIATPQSNCNNAITEIYLRFDVSGLPADVLSASIGFHHLPQQTYCYSNCVADFNFRRILNDWDEMTANQGSVQLGEVLAGPWTFAFPDPGGDREYDLTDEYRRWKSGEVTNHGIAVHSDTLGCNNAAISFAVSSSDEPDESLRPFLRLVVPAVHGPDGVGDACDACPDAWDPKQEDRDADGLGDACDGVPGDVSGDESVSLADFVLGRRRLLDPTTITDRDVRFCDLHPGMVVCPMEGPDPWCAAGDQAFALGDVVMLRRVLLQMVALDCEPKCEPLFAPAALTGPTALPGDVAPAAGDGRVDVADVVLALRLATGLEDVDVLRARNADVAPVRRDGSLVIAQGDGRVDVADVVVLLRAAVGLDEVAWPERSITIRVDVGAARAEAISLVVSHWPARAGRPAVTATDCGEGGAGVETDGDRIGVLCAGDGMASGMEVTVRYRAAEAVSLVELGLQAEAVDAELRALPVRTEALVEGSPVGAP